MHGQVGINSLLSRRSVLASTLMLAVIALAVTMPGLLGLRVGDALTGLEAARPAWLWAAAFSFLGSLVATASGWRSALSLCGGRLSRSDAAARYAIGSLVNSISPARIGEPVRLALFARALPGGDRAWRMGGAFGVIGAARALVCLVVLAGATVAGVVPVWPLIALTAVVSLTAALAFAARDRTPTTRAAHLLDAFRGLAQQPLGGTRVLGWIAAATLARFFGAVAIAVALGVRSPVFAALIMLPALDLAGLIPLSGNVGITSGAVAIALQTHGVSMSQALAAGLAFHAVETAAGLGFGLAGALVLARIDCPRARRRMIVLAGAGAAACLVAAFAATVVLPLA